MAIDGKMFRECMGRFPSGVVIATTVDKEGKRWGFTASAFSSLSLDPPLILVCLDLRAESHPVFISANKFAVNILRPEHEKVAMRFASKGGDKFSGGEFKAGKLGMPILPNALVSLECNMNAKYEMGDHTILVGLIEHSVVQDGSAMTYLGGKFYKLPPEESKERKTTAKKKIVAQPTSKKKTAKQPVTGTKKSVKKPATGQKKPKAASKKKA